MKDLKTRKNIRTLHFRKAMKATLITYSAKGLSKTNASKLSKQLMGYTDKSNKAKYIYKREGLLTKEVATIIAKSVFIVQNNKAKRIIDFIKKSGARVSFWEIEFEEKEFKN